MGHRIPWFAALIISIFLGGINHSAQVPPVPTTAPGALMEPEDYIRSNRLGITFISSIDSDDNAARYRNALILGAGWNRWPLYWDRIETIAESWLWSPYDELVTADVANGLQINAILLGRPPFRQDGDSIANLFEPVFADGADHTVLDVPINPNNPWAQFVYRVVSRYKPGGILASDRGFFKGAGIKVWEIWNEPDLPAFWRGGTRAYARLLKVAAIVIKTADPDATVMFGGLLFPGGGNFLSSVLQHFKNDELRVEYNWYFDAVAVHSYDDPWRSGWLTKVVQDTLAEFELARPVWVNETGVSVWDDYPGPVWATAAEERVRLATAQEQANFLIMSAAFAWAKGAQKVFYHQLYDDCGNQAAGSDFPPHYGELCSEGTCLGDAFGLYRNPRDAICFSQHPFADSPRPVAFAYRLLAEIFGRQPFNAAGITGLQDPVTTISFQRDNGERIIVVWNNTGEERTHTFKANSSRAVVYFLSGETSTVPAIDGRYSLNLKPAGDFSYPDLEAARSSAIGGEPVILVEAPG